MKNTQRLQEDKGEIRMAKANQRAIWEKGSRKTDAPSKRTQQPGLVKDNGEHSNKYAGLSHNHYPQGKIGYNIETSRLI